MKLMSDDMLPQGLQFTKTAWFERLETAEKSARLRREVPFVANTQFFGFQILKAARNHCQHRCGFQNYSQERSK